MNEMNHLEEPILRVLKRHRGSGNPITCRRLEKTIGFSSRQIRRTIQHLVVDHHVPIASSVRYPYGFYLITGKKEAENCLRQYYSRTKETLNRARILNKIVKDKFGVKYQEEFDFAGKLKPPTRRRLHKNS